MSENDEIDRAIEAFLEWQALPWYKRFWYWLWS